MSEYKPAFKSEYSEVVSLAVKLMKIERFRIKKVKDLKAGTYSRVYVNHENKPGFSTVSITRKPCMAKNLLGRDIRARFLSNAFIVPVVETQGTFGDWHSGQTNKAMHVADLIYYAHCYKKNHKTDMVIQELMGKPWLAARAWYMAFNYTAGMYPDEDW